MWVRSQVPQLNCFFYFFQKQVRSRKSWQRVRTPHSSLRRTGCGTLWQWWGQDREKWKLHDLIGCPRLRTFIPHWPCIGGSALLLLLHSLRPFCERDEWEASAGDCTALNYNLKTTQGGISQVIQSHPSSMSECRTVPRVKIQHVSIEQHAGQNTQEENGFGVSPFTMYHLTVGWTRIKQLGVHLC